MFASRWHSPPKPESVLSWTTGTCRRGDPVGVHAALHVALEHPDAEAVEVRAAPRSSSVVLPAPGRAHQVDHRDAGAVEVVAVGAGDRLRWRRARPRRPSPWCDASAPPRAGSSDVSIDSTSSSSPRTTSAPARSQSGHRNCGSDQVAADGLVARDRLRRRDPTPARTRRSASAPSTSSSSSSAPSQSGVAGDDARSRSRASRGPPGAARRPARRPAVTRRPPAWRRAVSTIALEIESSCIAQPPRRPRRTAARRPSRAPARRRARPPPATSGDSSSPISSPSCGSQATTTHLARPAADRLDEAQHGLRVHPVRADDLAVLDRRDLGRVGLDHVQRPRLAALAAGVDEDERVVAAHHLVGEVEATGAEVEHADPRRAARARRAASPRGRRSRRRASRRCRSRRRGSAAPALGIRPPRPRRRRRTGSARSRGTAPARGRRRR